MTLSSRLAATPGTVRLIALTSLITMLYTGCEVSPPSTLLEAPPPRSEGPAAVSPAAAAPAETLVWDYYLTPFDGEPWYLGWSSLSGAGAAWTSRYELFTVSGELRGLSLPDATACLLDDADGPLRCRLTRRAPTNGFDIGALARLVHAVEPDPGDVFRLPAYDLRQELAYELTLRAGKLEPYRTAWTEGLGLRVDCEPIGYRLWLAEDGWPERIECPEGFVERRRPPNE